VAAAHDDHVIDVHGACLAMVLPIRLPTATQSRRKLSWCVICIQLQRGVAVAAGPESLPNGPSAWPHCCAMLRPGGLPHVFSRVSAKFTFSCKFCPREPHPWHAKCNTYRATPPRQPLRAVTIECRNDQAAAGMVKTTMERTGARRSSGTGGIQSNRAPGARFAKSFGR
jgi:hypothetical protein